MPLAFNLIVLALLVNTPSKVVVAFLNEPGPLAKISIASLLNVPLILKVMVAPVEASVAEMFCVQILDAQLAELTLSGEGIETV